MKKFLLLLSLFTAWNLLLAQQTRFFIQPEVTVGSLQGNSRLAVDEYWGYTSAQSDFESLNIKKERANGSYGIGIKSGILVNNFLHLHTGLRYRKIVHEMVSYIDGLYCGSPAPFFITTRYRLLQTDFLEIPLGVRFNILKNSRVQPYLSSEIFWTKDVSKKDSELSESASAKNFDFFRIAYKAGVAYKIGASKNWEISLQAGFNTNLGKQKSYPRYHFREVTAEVGVLRAF